MADCIKKFCEHCSSELALKTWKTHRKLYYDEDTETWIKKACIGDEFDVWDDDSSMFDASTIELEPENEAPPQVDFNDDDDIFYDALLEQQSSPPIGKCYFHIPTPGVIAWWCHLSYTIYYPLISKEI